MRQTLVTLTTTPSFQVARGTLKVRGVSSDSFLLMSFFGLKKGGDGQIVQLDILDVAIKPPRVSKAATRRAPETSVCTDRIVVSEGNNKWAILCGENKTNLKQIRTQENQLTVDFINFDFAPLRGFLFRYSCEHEILSFQLLNKQQFSLSSAKLSHNSSTQKCTFDSQRQHRTLYLLSRLRL